MAGIKKQQATSLKWQSFQNKRAGPGKKPLPDPTTLQHVVVMIVMHLCRKVVLFEPEIKVSIYLGALVCGSVVTDFTPMPKSYFSKKTNFFNQFFVKWGWAWTLIVVGAFIGLTSCTYCCGNIPRIKKHFYRLLIATVAWFAWTKLFVLIEYLSATCYNATFTTKINCLKSGHSWKGFDISGHSFLLIYCSLVIAEEAKCIRGWERIGELIRNEEFDDDSPLKPLSEDELQQLQKYYESFTPYVRVTFILLTAFSILWDVMLVCTIIYYHTMVQKVVGGIIAIFTWFVTYRWWFYLDSSPGLPGQGLFKYSNAPVQRPRRMSAVGLGLRAS